MKNEKNAITEGKTALGIEFGSTRIKAVLIGDDHTVLAAGNHDWENRYENGIWTYTLEDIWTGVQDCYRNLAENVKKTYGVGLKKIGAVGISGMMHGYMAFDKDGKILTPFRTWRNTMTGEAASELTELFAYNIPQRWSIAHLYQAIRNGEKHVNEIHYMTTLAGYIHWKLTGRKVLGVGEASGMFPIDNETGKFDEEMLKKFDALVSQKNYSWKISELLPEVLTAGEPAGVLTEEGAGLLDPTGLLEAGIPLCPPEGDAGTGMVATNSVERNTGNVSAGTSIFAMIVLENKLTRVYPEIDLVTTPDGSPVAMVHCNNCTSDLNAWVSLFREFTEEADIKMSMDELYGLLYRKALEGEADCGGLLAYNYFSGEHITGLKEGRPLFVRKPESRFNLANFMRTHLFTSLGAIKIGMDILVKQENVKISRILGHGGLFKTPGAGQLVLSAALNAPVTVMETAGEGGAWGMAVLAAYRKLKKEKESLSGYLQEYVFANQQSVTLEAEERDVQGFELFMKNYIKGLPIEKAAVDLIR